MRAGINRTRRPFWLPASNYYVLAVAVTAAFFFLIWGILHDAGDETPWVTAGIVSSILLCGAVVLREVVLRRSHNRYIRQQKVFNATIPSIDTRKPHKLSLERNAAILNEIKQKSNAAKVLNKLSAGHREVFELCSGYLARNETELHTVNANSPRLAALLKGRSTAAKYHKYHLLKWAEIESRTLTDEARARVNAGQKIESAQNALGVIESALGSYPAEPSLLESKVLLREFVVSIKVSHTVEEAERAAFKGDYGRARSLYRDALFDLGRDNIQSEGRQNAAGKINAEIERICMLENEQ
ncbi:MAG: hypothetical protein ABIV21_01250 [Pyrinomonadaceae bacterium]